MSEKKFIDVACDVLNDSAQKNVLDFATFLQANDILPEIVGDTLWKAEHKGNCICYIHIDGAEQKPGPWTVWPDGDYSSEPKGFMIDGPTKEFAWEHANICGSCGGSCSPGKPATIFGKEFHNICNSVFAFNNPNGEALECLKKLIEIRKRAIQIEVNNDQ